MRKFRIRRFLQWIVFAQLVDGSRHHRTRDITAFHEGGWIEELRSLEREIVAVDAIRRRNAQKAWAVEEASRFDIDTRAVEATDGFRLTQLLQNLFSRAIAR